MAIKIVCDRCKEEADPTIDRYELALKKIPYPGRAMTDAYQSELNGCSLNVDLCGACAQLIRTVIRSKEKL